MKLRYPLKVKEIAGILGIKYTGSSDHLVTGLNEIHMVQPGDLTFADNPKYYSKALRSAATTILINADIVPPDGKVLLLSDDPFNDFVTLVKKFRPFESASYQISPDAQIGEDSVLQPGVFIGHHVIIGSNCLIHANVSIYDRCIIGDRAIIHSGSVIGADAFYYQKKDNCYRKLESCGRVIIEDDVEIGALCSVDRGVTGDTHIGSGTKLDNHVQIGHDTQIGKNCLIGAHAAIAGVTVLEDNVVLWGCVAINKDLVIGKGAVVLATSAVDKSLQGGKVYFGTPATEVRAKWRELAALRKLPDFFKKMNY
jgi:UDP-3-O-[3-hydroxymyristoyl] glucosamine N-acyltransferase